MSVNIKKNILGIALIILFIGCAGGAKSTTGSGVIPLDQAIKAAAIEIEKIIPRGTKIALLNFNSPTVRFSEYVLDELSANLVSNRILTIVDRKETDLILGEFNFQLSGHVSDDSMQELGRMLGAQAIVSGSLTEIGRSYRIMIRVLNVQTAIVEVQYRTDIINDNRVQSLLAGSRTSGTVNASGNTTTNSGLATQQTTSSSTGGRSSTPVVVQGSSITEKLQWLEENAINNTKYRIEVTNNESLAAPTLSFPRRRNVTVWLISSGAERILSLTGNGSLFTIESDVTLILDNGITLRGRNQNDASLVRVNSRGTLIMNDGSKITSNNFRGVSVLENANFIMNGGEISNNTGESGSGVAVWGNFTMLGGLIVGNTVHSSYISHLGGGVFIAKGGRFTLKGGEISNNKITGRVGLMAGGGVYVDGTFTMEGGEIYGNSSTNIGGGVAVNGIFRMLGGEISGNTASGDGGGVYVLNGTFNKTGGTIYGFSGSNNDNRAVSGHAVGGDKFRNSTAGPNVRLDSNRSGAAGGWEN